VIGAGVIGLSIARSLKRALPSCNIRILEKEHKIGLHTSGRNSGVLHAGFYYKTDS
jgi:L-2-hydroxyglutarate oxidase LhgO